MNSRRMGVIVLSLLIAAFVFAGCGRSSPPAPAGELEFTAVFEMDSAGSKVVNKINFTRDMQRIEVVNSRMGASIVRLDKGVVWYLMPSMGVYVQVPVRPENKNPLTYLPDTVEKWEKVGEETIDGHPTIKEKMVIKNKGSNSSMAFYRWFATDIRWPIKAEDEKGVWTLAYKEIHTGKQDPALFELPAGYRRMGNRMPN